MPDGRKHTHARVASLVTATLTTIGLGLATASPASAAPATDDLGSVQARVDRLSQKAAVAEKRHDRAATDLSGSRRQLNRLTTEIKHHRQVMDNLRSQVASTVVAQHADADTYDGGAGAAAPAAEMTEDSEVLLTNVTLVSEDTGATGEAMAASNARLLDLNQRRVDVRARTTAAAGVEKSLRSQEQQVDSRAAAAQAVLDELEAKVAA